MVWFFLPAVPSASCSFSFYFSVVIDDPYRIDQPNSPRCWMITGSSPVYPFCRPDSPWKRQNNPLKQPNPSFPDRPGLFHRNTPHNVLHQWFFRLPLGLDRVLYVIHGFVLQKFPFFSPKVLTCGYKYSILCVYIKPQKEEGIYHECTNGQDWGTKWEF